MEIRYFEDLAYGRKHEQVSEEDLCDLMELILAKEGGENVVTKILSMRLGF